jgi:hypothetical protein
MAIPLSTTSVTITRMVQPDDGYAEPTATVIARRVRAVISEPSGSRTVGYPGSLVDVSRKMTCDPVRLVEGDSVMDHGTGDTYEVAWSELYTGPYRHTTASLKRTEHLP